MLTVTEPDGTPRTEAVKPSPLLARLDAFLPKLAAANDSLLSSPTPDDAFTPQEEPLNPSQSPLLEPRTHRQDDPKSAPSVTDGSADESAVTMSIYIDQTLGQLVPSGQPEQQKQQHDNAIESSPLIQPLP